MNKQQIQTAINNYTTSTYQLASLLALAKKEVGRKHLLDSINMSPIKIDMLTAIAEIDSKHVTGLTPEHVQEVLGTKRKVYWLNQARTKQWTPIQLRKSIRKATCSIPIKKDNIKISQWARHLMLAESEIARTKDVNKDIIRSALERINNTITD